MNPKTFWAPLAMKLFGKKKPAVDLDQVLWLSDAPLFIDEVQVEAMYDAILRPNTEGVSVTDKTSVQADHKLAGGVELSQLLPWLGKTGLKLNGEAAESRAKGQEITSRVVSNAYRHLLLLVLHYRGKLDSRVLAVVPPIGGNHKICDDAYVDGLPRALVLLEFGPGTRLIPTALEVKGKVKLLLDDVGKEFADGDESAVPQYPGRSATAAERDAYWAWYADDARFSDRKALEAVEKAVSDERISWIDFRVPMGGGSQGPYLHLNIRARGAYDTGTFGYNFIRRGHRHGLRIVGTLKAEPDLNVLAIFER